MPDNLSKEARSNLMRRVKRKNTVPELLVRRELHARGLRFRVCAAALPGSPDIVFPRWRVALFVHGCFWHGHGCRQGRMPSSNRDYWVKKIEGNRERDSRKAAELVNLGWRVIVVWTCDLRSLDVLRCRMDDVADSIRGRLPVDGNGSSV